MKYKTIGAFKSVQNVGYCKATEEMKVGMGVILDRVAQTASLPASDDDAKACHRIVTNINDKAEMHNFVETVVVGEGEFVRADDLTTVANLEIEFADSEVDGGVEDLNAGDKLVFGTGGLVKKEASVDDYAVHFEVIAKTAYMGKGILAIIRVK